LTGTAFFNFKVAAVGTTQYTVAGYSASDTTCSLSPTFDTNATNWGKQSAYDNATMTV
jgi:hypothetical protein